MGRREGNDCKICSRPLVSTNERRARFCRRCGEAYNLGYATSYNRMKRKMGRLKKDVLKQIEKIFNKIWEELGKAKIQKKI